MTDLNSTKWPAKQIELKNIDKLVPYAFNSRQHTDEQIEQVANSIKEWGWTIPILVDENNQIIAGHCRVEAAKKLGITEVPVIIASNWTDEQKAAYLIADNKLSLNATWDDKLLANELKELQELDFNLELVGFSESELNIYLDSEFTNNNQAEEWKQMPEFSHEDQTSFRRIIVHFKSNTDVENFAKLIDQKISNKTRSIWFPPDEIGRIADIRYG